MPHTQGDGVAKSRFHKHKSCFLFYHVFRPMRHHHHLPIRHLRTAQETSTDNPAQKAKYPGQHQRHNQSKTCTVNAPNHHQRHKSNTLAILRRNHKLDIITRMPFVHGHHLQTTAPVGLHRISTAYSVQTKSENKFGLFYYQNDFRQITFGYYL